jgi:hypothetical protein
MTKNTEILFALVDPVLSGSGGCAGYDILIRGTISECANSPDRRDGHRIITDDEKQDEVAWYDGRNWDFDDHSLEVAANFRPLSIQDLQPSRESILALAKRTRMEIQQIFTDVEHWNDSVRKPDEAEIDPDPDGQLAKALKSIDAMLEKEGAN